MQIFSFLIYHRNNHSWGRATAGQKSGALQRKRLHASLNMQLPFFPLSTLSLLSSNQTPPWWLLDFRPFWRAISLNLCSPKLDRISNVVADKSSKGIQAGAVTNIWNFLGHTLILNFSFWRLHVRHFGTSSGVKKTLVPRTPEVQSRGAKRIWRTTRRFKNEWKKGMEAFVIDPAQLIRDIAGK